MSKAKLMVDKLPPNRKGELWGLFELREGWAFPAWVCVGSYTDKDQARRAMAERKLLASSSGTTENPGISLKSERPSD